MLPFVSARSFLVLLGCTTALVALLMHRTQRQGQRLLKLKLPGPALVIPTISTERQ